MSKKLNLNFKLDPVGIEENVEINNIYLSKNNPRYTLIKVSSDLKNFIGDYTYYDEGDVFLDLLQQEGDFSDLLKLLKSIYENDFNNKYDLIYLINLDSKMVVAEGNRRIMCLKLINNDLQLPPYEQIRPISLNYNEEEESNSSRNNYEKCNDLIKKISQKFNNNEEINIYCKIAADDEELWSILYNDKHLTGEKTGLRKWSRGKYLADLINNFPNGINSNDNLFIQTKEKFQVRDFEKIKKDYKNALFVYSVIAVATSKEKLTNGNLNYFNNQDVLNEMISIRGISSLELEHSFYKIRKIICEEILNITKEEFQDEYFSINFSKIKNYFIEFSEKKIKTKNLFNFIYTNWENKVITTRDIAKEKYEDFIHNILILLDGQNYRNSLSKEELRKINFFNLSDVALDNLIMANAIQNPEEVKIIQSYRNIKDNNAKFIKWVKKNFQDKKINTMRIEPICVFYNLIEQAKSINPKFLNAQAATFRSILEQITLWVELYFKIKDKKNDQEKLEHLNKFINNQKPRVFKKNKDKNKDEEEDEYWITKDDVNFHKFITEFTDFNINDEFIKNWREKFFSEKIWAFMNKCIHSFHFIYFSNRKQKINSFNIIQEFEIYQKDILELLEHLKIDKFQNINQEIIKLLSQEDEDYKK